MLGRHVPVDLYPDTLRGCKSFVSTFEKFQRPKPDTIAFVEGLPISRILIPTLFINMKEMIVSSSLRNPPNFMWIGGGV